MDISSQQFNQVPIKKQSPLSWILVVVGLLVALVGYVFLFSSTVPNVAHTTETQKEIAPGEIKTTAQKGALVVSFPKELILGGQGVILESYSITYEKEKRIESHVVFSPKDSYQKSIDGYYTYLKDAGWEVIQEGGFFAGPKTSFHAIKEGETVDITLTTENGTETIVSIIYSSIST